MLFSVVVFFVVHNRTLDNGSTSPIQCQCCYGTLGIPRFFKRLLSFCILNYEHFLSNKFWTKSIDFNRLRIFFGISLPKKSRRWQPFVPCLLVAVASVLRGNSTAAYYYVLVLALQGVSLFGERFFGSDLAGNKAFFCNGSLDSK